MDNLNVWLLVLQLLLDTFDKLLDFLPVRLKAFLNLIIVEHLSNHTPLKEVVEIMFWLLFDLLVINIGIIFGIITVLLWLLRL